jgi:dienelactone hydrolase
MKVSCVALGVLAVVAAGCAVAPSHPAPNDTFEGFPVISSVPPDPAGIVFLFHGSGGGAEFATKPEVVDLLDHLTAAGYGFVSTESTDRTTKRWDTASLSLSANEDLARLERLHASMRASGTITDRTPIYAVGMSRGAGFAAVFAQAFEAAGYQVAAIAPSHGQIPSSVRSGGGLTVPGFFTLGANDPVVDNDRVVAQVEDVIAAGVAATYTIEPETALQASRFLRVPGVDRTTADAIFSVLVTAGLWDEVGHRLASIATVQSTLPSLSYPPNVTNEQKRLLREQINVVLAVHEFSATYASQTVAFFDAHRSPTPRADVSPRWARTLSGPTNEDEFDGVAAAPDGSVYATGKFERTATLGGASLSSAGRADIPLARFAGTVAFGSATLTSSGRSDCVIAAFRLDGSTRWARRFGGPFRDGCNEVSIDPTGTITTSLDTEGGWAPLGGPPIPRLDGSDTVLLRLGSDGTPQWMRRVGGSGAQRGKALAVAPDGSVSFGGDTVGPLEVGSRTVPTPTDGTSRDAWLSRWAPDGTLEWITAWGGPADDLAKGVADDGRTVSYVGPFTGTISVGSTTLDAGTGADTLVAQRSAAGQVRWATSVSASADLDGRPIPVQGKDASLWALDLAH